MRGNVVNSSVTGYRMPADSRPRRLVMAALTVALAALIAGCVQNPNSVFHHRTDFNRDVSSLFRLLIWLGTIVFIFTEAMLVWALIKYRSRPGKPHEPEQVHGNTRLEILWTVIPAVVLAVIAVPTVRTIFKTEAPAPAGSLEIEVIGHQWWWEFRYPEYGVVTANELYLPIGRTASFALKTHDVIHSFWIPGLGGKRDLVNNRTNHLWFTPDSTTETAFNGFCAEFCGTSHANMRFPRVYGDLRAVCELDRASTVARGVQPWSSRLDGRCSGGSATDDDVRACSSRRTARRAHRFHSHGPGADPGRLRRLCARPDAVAYDPPDADAANGPTRHVAGR